MTKKEACHDVKTTAFLKSFEFDINSSQISTVNNVKPSNYYVTNLQNWQL